MSDTSAVDRLATGLKQLLEVTGLSRGQIENYGKTQTPPVNLGKSKTSPWFNGKSVPEPGPPFDTLVKLLEDRAFRKVGRPRQGVGMWQLWRKEAAEERRFLPSGSDGTAPPPQTVRDVSDEGRPFLEMSYPGTTAERNEQHKDRFREAPAADVCLRLIKAARRLREAFAKSEETVVVLEVHRNPEMRRRYANEGELAGGLTEAQQWWNSTQTHVVEAYQRLLDVIDMVDVYGPKEVREQLAPLADLGKELVEISSWSHPIESDDSLVIEGKVMDPYDAVQKYNAVLQSIRDAAHTTNK
ncbi:hypothetical protein [Streptomyces hydrogenans]|uniref:hypothetical protein n=1 Tax=Streptomyces hydrogenans TaxID=1873719 RepID=UPI00343F19D6